MALVKDSDRTLSSPITFEWPFASKMVVKLGSNFGGLVMLAGDWQSFNSHISFISFTGRNTLHVSSRKSPSSCGSSHRSFLGCSGKSERLYFPLLPPLSFSSLKEVSRVECFRFPDSISPLEGVSWSRFRSGTLSPLEGVSWPPRLRWLSPLTGAWRSENVLRCDLVVSPRVGDSDSS